MADEKPEETKKDDADKPTPHKPRFNAAEAAMEYLVNNLETAQSKLRAAGYDVTGMDLLTGGLRSRVKDAVRKHGGWTIPIVETAVSQGIKLLPMNPVLRGIVGPVVDLYFHGLRAVAVEKDETKQRDALTVSQTFLDNAWSEIQKHKPPKATYDDLEGSLNDKRLQRLWGWISYMARYDKRSFAIWRKMHERIKTKKQLEYLLSCDGTGEIPAPQADGWNEGDHTLIEHASLVKATLQRTDWLEGRFGNEPSFVEEVKEALVHVLQGKDTTQTRAIQKKSDEFGAKVCAFGDRQAAAALAIRNENRASAPIVILGIRLSDAVLVLACVGAIVALAIKLYH